jgi:hypothetical protein
MDTNNKNPEESVGSPLQSKEESFQQSISAMSNYAPQGQNFGRAHVNGEDGELKDANGGTDLRGDQIRMVCITKSSPPPLLLMMVRQVVDTPHLLANQIPPASFKFNDGQTGTGGEPLTSNISTDVDYTEPHWKMTGGCECETIKSFLENCTLSFPDRPLKCKLCGERIQINKSQDVEKGTGQQTFIGYSNREGSDMPVMNSRGSREVLGSTSSMNLGKKAEDVQKTLENARLCYPGLEDNLAVEKYVKEHQQDTDASWWTVGSYYTEEMNKDMVEYLCVWGGLEHEPEPPTFPVEDDDVPLLPDHYDGTDTIRTNNLLGGPEEFAWLLGN